jgi:hypothetical protein
MKLKKTMTKHTHTLDNEICQHCKTSCHKLLLQMATPTDVVTSAAYNYNHDLLQYVLKKNVHLH